MLSKILPRFYGSRNIFIISKNSKFLYCGTSLALFTYFYQKKATLGCRPNNTGEEMASYIESLQSRICKSISELDGKSFVADNWQRDNDEGYGKTCVLQDGNVFEKAGVNISVVKGVLPKEAILQMKTKFDGLDVEKKHEFYVASISLVIHAHNPFIPTVHLNYRYFELRPSNGSLVWWFGGGSDLTPHYLIEEDAIHFHKTLKKATDKVDKNLYKTFKQWCDKYFYIKHRSESRGVGGIFFDDLNTINNNSSANEVFELIKTLGDSFLDSYIPIVEKRKDRPYNKQQKAWSQIRKGRYVEFNLVYDRGTKFGLLTPNSKIESILVSLPLYAKWEYNHKVEEGSEEQKLLEILKKPKQWA